MTKKSTGRIADPEEMAQAQVEAARVQREQAAEAERLKAEKTKLERQVADAKAAQAQQQREAEERQAQITARQKAERDKRLHTPLSAEEREHMARLETMANSGRAVPSESMLTLGDYRIRAKNEAAAAEAKKE